LTDFLQEIPQKNTGNWNTFGFQATAMEKSAYNDEIERIGKLESAALAAKKTAEVNASGSRGRRPVMRLG
jgi:hypothetical protein